MKLPTAVPMMLIAAAASLALPPLLFAQEPTTTTTTATTTTPAPPEAYGAPATPVVAKGGGVTIADFQFTPATVAVSVGDTVTWTNSGPSDHTVTAGGGQFDSGTLAQGQSFSHTFGSAGTFSYVCSIHPEMTGTVQVSAPSGAGGTDQSGGDPGSGTPGTDPTATTPATGASSQSAAAESPGASGTSSSLPATGLAVLPLALASLGLFGLGVAAWRRATRSTS